MKKGYLFAISILFFIGCVSDIEVNYSEQSGYLTDVYSVKYGLSGFWQGDDEYTIKCDQYGSVSASFLSQGYLISSYNIIYDVYKEQDVFILKIKNIQRQGLYSPSGQIPELKKLLETAIKNNDENKIRAINEQIERLEHVVSLMNTHNQKPVLDTPIYAEIIRLDKSTCIVEIIKFDEFGIIIYTGERYIRTKIK